MKKLLSVAAAAVVSAAVLQAADCPQWQGADRTRVSKETGLMKEWPASGPAVVWTATGLGSGYGSMAVAGERVFVQGTRGGNSIVGGSSGDKMSCEEISAGFYRDRPSTERSELTKVDAISLRREGDQAFLLYHGPEYDTGGSYGPGDLYAMSLRFEDGGWKMGSATGTSLGIAKSLVNG